VETRISINPHLRIHTSTLNFGDALHAQGQLPIAATKTTTLYHGYGEKQVVFWGIIYLTPSMETLGV